MRRRGARTWALLLVGALALAGCGGSGSEETAAPVEDKAMAATDEVVETSSSSAITSATGVQPATIQIVARGTFRDPEVGQTGGSGAGSGFLISPDGFAVTNNHVVTGAATLDVYIGGDTSKSYNATVVGVSECNDLAVIKIANASDLPYLEWHTGDISAGMDIYVAGFPLGNPEFTLTRGIVSKAQANGENSWASIDHVIEHDARQHPGNSGGPLVSEAGRVVGVNYKGGTFDGGLAPLNYSIAADLARPVVESLKNGDFESLGINGWPVAEDDISGIWVAGVAPGSPASQVGLKPGDIVTSMNGLPVGSDGLLTDYCKVIRTSGDSAPIKIEVLRFDTLEMLQGEIRGDEKLEVAFSFAQAVEEELGTDLAVASTAYTYVRHTDDTGTIAVEMPAQWADVDTEPAYDGDTVLPYIMAATNRSDYMDNWTTPGMLLVQFPYGAGGSIDGLLAEYSAGFAAACSDGGIYPYEDVLYNGKFQMWTNCGGTSSSIVTLVAQPMSGAFRLLIQAQLVTDADLDALQRAFDTFVSFSAS